MSRKVKCLAKFMNPIKTRTVKNLDEKRANGCLISNQIVEFYKTGKLPNK